MRTVRCIVTGRVQGVWFRGSTQKEAQRFGVTGWALNRDDGSVEVVAHGDDAAVNALVAWLHKGPRLARVDAVQVEPAETKSPLTTFEVR
ncbi:MAG: acylphosphatase [Gammaproteobacteria bacterium]